MTVRAALREIIDGMESQSDEMAAYLKIKTGRVVPVSDEDLAPAEAGERAIPTGPTGRPRRSRLPGASWPAKATSPCLTASRLTSTA